MKKSHTSFNLVQCDCVEGMDKLKPSSVDVVVTSPPYNLGTKYKTYEDKKELTDYLEWTKQWVLAVHTVLKPSGSFFLNIAGTPARPLLPMQVALAIVQHDFVLQNTIHWIKSGSIETRDGKTISAGHFKPINSDRYITDCHEFVYHFTKTGDVKLDRLAVGVEYMDKSNVTRFGAKGRPDKRCRGNTWFIPYDTIVSRDKQRPHPATFPPKLAEMCILLHGRPEKSTVIDPFVGIGSAALGAKAAGVKEFVGFDIDAYYIETAQKRVGA